MNQILKLLLLACFASTNIFSFKFNHFKYYRVTSLSSTTSPTASSTPSHTSTSSHTSTESPSTASSWTGYVDGIIDVTTDCDTKRELTKKLKGEKDEIRKDIRLFIQNPRKNYERIIPKERNYTKAYNNFQAFRKQWRNDILPDIIGNQIPNLINNLPSITKDIIEGTSKLASVTTSKNTTVSSTATKETKTKLTKTEISNEIKNIFLSTPIGLETPSYKLLNRSGDYEIRMYDAYSVCCVTANMTAVSSSSKKESSIDGTYFNSLASYLFGDNNQKMAMAMTTPVITTKDTMEFVLPRGLNASSAPMPVDGSDIFLQDVRSEIVGAKEFSGVATAKEVLKQRRSLEDYLISQGIAFDNLSLKIMQYNPPYTLPWLRRNEVILKLVDYVVPHDDTNDKTHSTTDSNTANDASDGDKINDAIDASISAIADPLI